MSVVLGLLLPAVMVTAKRDKVSECAEREGNHLLDSKLILFNLLLKDRIASERIIQADVAAAEPKIGDKANVKAANGMRGKMCPVSLA